MANPNPIEAAHQGIESALRAGVDLRQLVAELRDASISESEAMAESIS